MVSVIGIGIDAVDIDRLRTILERTPTFVDRVFAQGELAYARQANDPTERLAARFAAKEAFLKALGEGLGACAMGDVEVIRASSGAPSLRLGPTAAELSARHGVISWEISLTHTETMAVAVALAVGISSTGATSRSVHAEATG